MDIQLWRWQMAVRPTVPGHYPAIESAQRNLAMHSTHTEDIVHSDDLRNRLYTVFTGEAATGYMWGNQEHSWVQLAILFFEEQIALDVIAKGWGIDRLGPEKTTTLHYAAIKGFEKVALRCLQIAPSQKTAEDGDGQTPYDYALGAGHVHLLPHLANGEESIDKKAPMGLTAFLNACYWGDKVAREYCLKQGANITAAMNNGDTALHISAIKGDEELATFLLSRIPKEIRNGAGQTASDIAIEEGSEKVWRIINPGLPHPNLKKP